MGVVDTITDLLMGGSSEPNRYECRTCGTTFESHMGADNALLSCSDCNSDDVRAASAD